MSKDESRKGEVDHGAKLLRGWPSELSVDPMFHGPNHKSSVEKESHSPQPQINSQWLQEDPSIPVIAFFYWDKHCYSRLSVRQSEIDV